MQTRKRLLALLFTAALLLAINVTAYAHEVPDLERLGTINVTMHCGETVVPGGTLTLYRVGDIVEDDGNYSFALSGVFAKSGLTLDDAQSPELAQNLAKYADKATGVTVDVDKNGKAVFAIEAGLYLLVQSKAADGYTPAAPFLISMPNWENDRYHYEVDASPKVSIQKAPAVSPMPVPTTPPTKLPQTGQLNWPVPVLVVLGLALFSLGWGLRFGRRKDSHEK